MSSTQKPKYMGKPFIKKIYETHKKWLGGDSKLLKQEKTECVRRNSSNDAKKVLPDYENSAIKSAEEEKRSTDLDSIQSDKLRIVINSFDKILDEYSSNSYIIEGAPVSVIEIDPSKFDPPPVPKRHSLPVEVQSTKTTEAPAKIVPPPRRHSTPRKDLAKQKEIPLTPSSTTSKTNNTKIPKLVKAKTCSIIESKCILKKTSSSTSLTSSMTYQSNMSNKTKSMNNLDMNAPTPTKIIPISIDSPIIQKNNSNKISPKVPPKPTAPIATPDNAATPQKSTIDSSVKVKELVKRLNSLTETIPSDTHQVQPPAISKAVSTTNLSLSKKHGSMSKIPVNSNLRKSFPSTPCHLDEIDSNGSAPVENKLSKAKSVQNLAKPRLSLPTANCSSTKPVTRAKSVQNLAKPKYSLPKDDLVKNKSLNKPSLTKVKIPNKTNSKPPEVKAKVSSGASVSKPNPSVSGTREKSKSNLKLANNNNLSVAKSKQTNTKDKVDASKNLTKKADKIKLADDVDPKQAAFVAIKGPRDKKVNTVIKKLEDQREPEELNAGPKVIRNQTFKKSVSEDKTIPNTFGDKKAQYEPKFAEKSSKNIRKGTFRKTSPSRIKLDLQRTKDFLGKVVSKEDSKFYLDPQGFIDIKDGSAIKDIKSEKHLDYNSDNSDDSGNISNEVDCDELNSTVSSVRSRTSTESLSTVLDVSSVSKDLSEVSIVPKEAPAQIFFRTGVVSQLEAQRDERLAGVVISLQAHCRGYLARRKLQQRKLQDLAVRCIQRNVRKFMLVRDWPWWRLLVRVTPLLNVHRTEEELRAKTVS